MAGITTELTVAARLFSRSMARRLRSKIEPPEDPGRFQDEFQRLVDKLPHSTIRDVHWVELKASDPPWVDSSVFLEGGQEATYFVCGRTYLSRLLDVWLDARLQVWSKIGRDGDVIRATRSSNTVRSDRSGTLLFGNFLPNMWADSKGTLEHDKRVYRSVTGGYRILVVLWQGSAIEGLKRLLAVGDVRGLVKGEIERLEQGNPVPEGWGYTWRLLGDAEVYSTGTRRDGELSIECCANQTVGIISREVSMPLTQGTSISWRWLMDQLPSTIREDAALSHDYLSIAVEFDNDMDITYYWSSELPVGTGYFCPLVNWKDREFHVVTRSGEEGLGAWHDERQNLYEDWGYYIGKPAPERIERVWLIANSAFQRGIGRCAYGNIRLEQGSESVKLS